LLGLGAVGVVDADAQLACAVERGANHNAIRANAAVPVAERADALRRERDDAWVEHEVVVAQRRILVEVIASQQRSLHGKPPLSGERVTGLHACWEKGQERGPARLR